MDKITVTVEEVLEPERCYFKATARRIGEFIDVKVCSYKYQRQDVSDRETALAKVMDWAKQMEQEGIQTKLIYQTPLNQ